MPVIYDEQSLPRPYPLVDIQKQYIKDSNKQTLYPEYTFTLTGVLLSENNTMPEILNLQEEIRGIFSVQNKRLEITSPGGAPEIIDAYCEVESINFERSTWTQRCDYTVVLKANVIEGEDVEPSGLKTKNETWTISELDDGTYTVVHAIEAQGLPLYGPGGLTNDPLNSARAYCQSKKVTLSNGSINPAIKFGTNNLDTITNPTINTNATNSFWNYAVIESVGEEDNSWSLTENFIYSSGVNFREEWSAGYTINNQDTTKSAVNIEGTVFGFAPSVKDYNTKITNAQFYFANSVKPNLYLRAINNAPDGYFIDPSPISSQVSKDITQGNLRYAYVYQASATSGLIDGAIEESISIVDTGNTDVFALISVPGRENGPVVQYMETVNLPERSISITAKMSESWSQSPSGVVSLLSAYTKRPNVDNLIDALKPNQGRFYTRTNTAEWNPIQRTFARNVAWVLQPEALSVSGVPDNINRTSL
jgi:hypothetical protein